MADEEGKTCYAPVSGDDVEDDSTKVTEEESEQSEEESLVYDRPRSATSNESGMYIF